MTKHIKNIKDKKSKCESLNQTKKKNEDNLNSGMVSNKKSYLETISMSNNVDCSHKISNDNKKTNKTNTKIKTINKNIMIPIVKRKKILNESKLFKSYYEKKKNKQLVNHSHQNIIVSNQKKQKFENDEKDNNMCSEKISQDKLMFFSDSENKVISNGIESTKKDLTELTTNLNMDLLKRNFSDKSFNINIKLKSEKKYNNSVISSDTINNMFLHDLYLKNDIKNLKLSILNGFNVNATDINGFTILHIASFRNDLELISFLIEMKADVNVKSFINGHEQTPLFCAAENRNFDVIKLLLENGADPKIVNIHGINASNIIYYNFSDQDNFKDVISCFKNASKNFDVTLFNTFEDLNESYFKNIVKKKSIYKYSADGSKKLLANYFLSGNNLESEPDILIIASRNGHLELVDIILGLNSSAYDIDTKNCFGLTALLASVGRGNIEVVKFLLSKNADPLIKRKQDDLNSLEIVQTSLNFDINEFKLLYEAIIKKSKTSTLSYDKNFTFDFESKNLIENIPILNQKDLNHDIILSVTSDNQKTEKVKRKKKLTDDLDLKKKKKKNTIDIGDFKNDFKNNVKLVKKNKFISTPTLNVSLKDLSSSSLSLKDLNESNNCNGSFISNSKTEKKSKKIKKTNLKNNVISYNNEDKNLDKFFYQETFNFTEKKKLEVKFNLILRQFSIGLKDFILDSNEINKNIYFYTPLYIFNINKIDYVIDLQLSLLIGCNNIPISKKLDYNSTIGLNFNDKSKIWMLLFKMIGIDRNNPFNLWKYLFEKGYNQFKLLSINFINFEKVTEIIKHEYSILYQLVWVFKRFNHVSYDSLNCLNYLQSSNTLHINNSNQILSMNLDNLHKKIFIPKKFKHRKNVLKIIHLALKS